MPAPRLLRGHYLASTEDKKDCYHTAVSDDCSCLGSRIFPQRLTCTSNPPPTLPPEGHSPRQAGRQSAPLQGAPSKWLWVRLSWSISPISRAKVPALRELLGEGETEVHEPKSRCMGGKKWGRVVRGGGIAWVFDRCWVGPGLGDGEVRGGLPCLLPKAFPHLSGGRTGWGGRVWLSGHTN